MSNKYKGEFLGFDFIFWFGVVEDRNDPIKLGRVRVRIQGWHTDDKSKIPTSSLPWAQVVQQPTSAANGDIGYSPTGILEGTWVVGFFLDGEKAQQPIVMGTLAGIPTQAINTGKGFNDPNGVYPKRLNEPDVNRLARNDSDFPHPNIQAKNSARTTAVPIAGGGSWNEPVSAYAATYPKNHVYESESGHIKEYDDTKNNERIHEYHKSGTFYEIDKDGNRVTRVVGDNYEVVAGSNYVNIKGDANLTVNGSLNIKASDVTIDGGSFIKMNAGRIDLN